LSNVDPRTAAGASRSIRAKLMTPTLTLCATAVELAATARTAVIAARK
jgi:hypothetical protein